MLLISEDVLAVVIARVEVAVEFTTMTFAFRVLTHVADDAINQSETSALTHSSVIRLQNLVNREFRMSS